MKNKSSRKSRGVAFVQFLTINDAQEFIQKTDKQEVCGRPINCSIAIDNGRTSEFIKKRLYPNKTRCYECGDSGHLSYSCPKNVFGLRNPPKKKIKKGFKKIQNEEERCNLTDVESLPDDLKINADTEELNEMLTQKRKKYKSGYFSDEEYYSYSD
ncbi:zinc finger CCHC-type and RNA-binding motif-containing protein 1 isoform X2 [Halyomorpha halys]